MKNNVFPLFKINPDCILSIINYLQKIMVKPTIGIKTAPILIFSLILTILNINSLFAQQENTRTSKVIDIGSRLELFVDNYVIGKLEGKAELCLHHPVPQEVAVLHDAPWEGSDCHYHSIFKDGNLYRMYYRGWQIGTKENVDVTPHPPVYCYAESEDGIHWRKPTLNLFNFDGSKVNNIVLANGYIGNFQLHLSDNASMFKDDNQNTSSDAQYKALVYTDSFKGLLAFKSRDGIHWLPMSEQAVITDGVFDSQNLAFWDTLGKEYRAYWRIFSEGVRAIRTATSKDFIHWENQADLKYIDSPPEQLYTNQVLPYFRAPHIFIGFPARYIDRGWSKSMCSLPELEHRKIRSKASPRYGTALTEGLFMASRDGVNFKRWNEAFLRPGIEREGTWNYGQQYIGWGIVETKSPLEGAPNELSIYATENEWTGTSSILRRYTLRIDGFVSVHAPMSGGELITKDLIFFGDKLKLNFSSSAAGDIKVEIQDDKGKPLPGYALEDCPPIFGDSIEREVFWNKGSDLSILEGKPIRLRFVIRDADLFSFQFK